MQVEATGKSIEEAKQKAMEMLGVDDESRVSFEIIDEPSRGLFGVMNGMAIIRASLIDDESEENGEEPSVTPEPEQVQKIVEIIHRIITLSGFYLDARHRGNKGKYVHVELIGKDAPYLLQHRAETLDAIQYLVNMMISRSVSPDIRVVVDAQNYRRRREESLRNLAISLAMQVKERQEEAELDPLPAHERRIIHRALLSDMDISTYSEGEEPNRYVVISPKKREG